MLRMLWPEATFFGPDQVGLLLEGRGVLQGHLFPEGPGIGWTPFALGPLFGWVSAVALVVRDDFADVIVLVALLHAIAVLAWRRLLAKVLGPSGATESRFAAWALAFHPLSISSG